MDCPITVSFIWVRLLFQRNSYCCLGWKEITFKSHLLSGVICYPSPPTKKWTSKSPGSFFSLKCVDVSLQISRWLSLSFFLFPLRKTFSIQRKLSVWWIEWKWSWWKETFMGRGVFFADIPPFPAFMHIAITHWRCSLSFSVLWMYPLLLHSSRTLWNIDVKNGKEASFAANNKTPLFVRKGISLSKTCFQIFQRDVVFVMRNVLLFRFSFLHYSIRHKKGKGNIMMA